MSETPLLQKIRKWWHGTGDQATAEDATDHAFSFPTDHEDGWHSLTVSPQTRTYEEEECLGGPPTTHSIYRYIVKGDAVFAQLTEQKSVNYNGTTFDVVDGKVLEQDIRKRTSFDWAVAALDDDIASLERDVSLHQITGAVRYCILSLHGWTRNDFAKERNRVQKDFDALAVTATTLGAARVPGSYFKLENDATDEARKALDALYKPEALAALGFTFPEIIQHEQIMTLLAQLPKESA